MIVIGIAMPAVSVAPAINAKEVASPMPAVAHNIVAVSSTPKAAATSADAVVMPQYAATTLPTLAFTPASSAIRAMDTPGFAQVVTSPVEL
jgi:hypothetical protein